MILCEPAVACIFFTSDPVSSEGLFEELHDSAFCDLNFLIDFIRFVGLGLLPRGAISQRSSVGPWCCSLSGSPRALKTQGYVRKDIRHRTSPSHHLSELAFAVMTPNGMCQKVNNKNN